MPLLEGTLLLLLAVALSVVVADLLCLPLALLQIAVGFVIAPIIHATDINDPALFMMLFVAPLLFVDAYLAPRKQLLRVGGSISLMAIGLVGITVIIAGWSIHWLVPAMPLAVSFALAAALSPTDAVALSSSLRGVEGHTSFMHILEGEALLNDSTGLVCFRFAVVAAITGNFSWESASLALLTTSLGGILAGSALAFAVARVELWIQRTAGPQPASQVLLGLLLPFGSYMVAERLHCSGVLAAVAAGFVLSWLVRDLLAPATRSHGVAVIEMLQMTFNGVIFVFLGARLPVIARDLHADGMPSFGHLCLLVASVSGLLILIRVVWGLITLVPLRRTDEVFSSHLSWLRNLLFFGFAGVRGALTLASVLSLPLLTAAGSPLLQRELAIVLATGVILLSLLVAPIALRLLRQHPMSLLATQTAQLTS